jgi:hypothetical protein
MPRQQAQQAYAFEAAPAAAGPLQPAYAYAFGHGAAPAAASPLQQGFGAAPGPGPGQQAFGATSAAYAGPFSAFGMQVCCAARVSVAPYFFRYRVPVYFRCTS